MLQRTKIFGLDLINDADFNATIESMLHFQQEFDPASGKLPLLFTPNVDDVVKLNEKKYAELAKILQRSFYILPDGQFIVIASKLLGKPLKKRLPGSDLFPLLWKSLKENNKRIMVIAPSEKVGELLKKEYANMVYYVPPFFDEEDKEALNKVIDGCIPLFDSFRPEYVFLGIRFPKQNYIALELIEHHNKLNSQDPLPTAPANCPPLFLLLGASYEFYLNLKKRAPIFWQRISMEWFYRFLQEPKRLFKRFFIDDLAFIGIFLKEFRKK